MNQHPYSLRTRDIVFPEGTVFIFPLVWESSAVGTKQTMSTKLSFFIVVVVVCCVVVLVGPGMEEGRGDRVAG